ncbi:MAG: hypothetical protein ABJF23_20145 [Bryobacteraceae bacterium]
MSTKQKRKIAKKNGAKAAGAKSPQGIQTSAKNALRHGLTSKTLVLANESPEKFTQLLQAYIGKFQPTDEVEMNLVDEMVAARWRQQRAWAIQTAALDLQMETQTVEVRGEPARVAHAFIAMAKEEKVLELILRYEISFSRMHDRAMKELFRLREKSNLRNDPDENETCGAHPVVPSPESPSILPGTPVACSAQTICQPQAEPGPSGVAKTSSSPTPPPADDHSPCGLEFS